MSQKKYISLSSLETFLKKLPEKFSPLEHKHKLEDIKDYQIDNALSDSSENPVQNKIINEEFEAVSDAMGALELAIDNHIDEKNNPHEVTAEQVGALPISGGTMTGTISWGSIEEPVPGNNAGLNENMLVFATIPENSEELYDIMQVNSEGVMVGYIGYNAYDRVILSKNGIIPDKYWNTGGIIGLTREVDENYLGETLTLGNFELSHSKTTDTEGKDVTVGAINDAIISGVHEPLADDHVANKKYVDEAVASGGSVKTVNGLSPDENGNIEVTIDNVEIPVFSVVGTTLVISNAIQQAEGASY